MKIKEQTSKLAAGFSKNCFEVVDKTDEVSSKHCFEVVDRTDEVSYIYLRQGDVDVVWRDFRRVLYYEKEDRRILFCCWKDKKLSNPEIRQLSFTLYSIFRNEKV